MATRAATAVRVRFIAVLPLPPAALAGRYDMTREARRGGPPVSDAVFPNTDESRESNYCDYSATW
nr:hypothetical protein StreXyl84_04320 [Streptomyces sp. Xyl84]